MKKVESREKRHILTGGMILIGVNIIRKYFRKKE
jgi:hypothetical protein